MQPLLFSNFGPSIAHVPKAINGDFRDMMRVRTLRRLDLEKMEKQTGRLASALGRFGDLKGDDRGVYDFHL